MTRWPRVRSYSLIVLTCVLASPVATADDQLSAELRRLPHVASVDVRLDPKQPRQTIIHLRDWHYVPKELFAIDVRDASEKPLNDAAIDKLYEQHLDAVGRVQTQHRAILKRLISDRNLKEVYKEGLAKEHMPFFIAKLSATRRLGKAITELTPDAKDPPNDAWAKRFNRLSHQYRLDRLRLGAAAQLAIDGSLRRVRPIEKREAYEKGQLVTGDTITIDKAAIEAREDAITENLLNGPALVVVELGGAHDLSDNLRRLAPRACRYIRVTTDAYRDIQ